jgi:hypothetical protein
MATRRTKMINKSFEFKLVKDKKGKIDVKFDEITKISSYVKEESNNLLLDLLGKKIDEFNEQDEQQDIETPEGGKNE